MSELLAACGVGLGLAAGGLAESYRLCSNSQTGSVHQRHHIFDETQTTLANNLAGCVGELQLGGGTALDAHLVLYAAYGHAAVGFVKYEVT